MQKAFSKILVFLKKLVPNLIFTLAIVLLFYAVDFLYSKYNSYYRFSLLAIKPGYWLSYVLLLSFVRSSKIKTFVIVLISLFSWLEFMHFQYFAAFVQPMAFLQIFQATAPIINSVWPELPKMIVPTLIVFVMMWVILLVNWNFDRRKILLTSRYAILVGLVIISMPSFRTYKILNTKVEKFWNRDAEKMMPVEGRHSAHNFISSLKYFALGIVPRKVFGDVKLYGAAKPPEAEPKSKAKNVILIIGETLRAQQMSILGYPEPTTPLLEKQRDLFAKTVIASGTMSITSIGAIMHRLEYPGATEQIASQNNCLFKLAKKNSYRTYFFSAHIGPDLKLVDNLICRSFIDTYYNHTTFSEERYPLSEYDIGLMEYLKQVDEKTDNFIVLHQRGSHEPHELQYPPEFDKFVMPYDNSVLYTDFILSKILDTIQTKFKNETYVFFTSDHGQVLYEDNEKLFGHGWFKKQVYEVPFLFKSFHVKNSKISANDLDFTETHFDISNLVTRVLGYKVEIDKNSSRTVYVNGSDIDALAGYMKIDIKNKKIVSSQIIR